MKSYTITAVLLLAALLHGITASTSLRGLQSFAPASPMPPSVPTFGQSIDDPYLGCIGARNVIERSRILTLEGNELYSEGMKAAHKAYREGARFDMSEVEFQILTSNFEQTVMNVTQAASVLQAAVPMAWGILRTELCGAWRDANP